VRRRKRRSGTYAGIFCTVIEDASSSAESKTADGKSSSSVIGYVLMM
jgi:hypothetical protein